MLVSINKTFFQADNLESKLIGMVSPTFLQTLGDT